MEWVLADLTRPVTVAALARVAGMSERGFIRHFGRRAGTSPLRWVIAQRIAASLPLLETTAAPIEEIAAAVGFESPVTFRHHFGRSMRTSPSAYRKAFRRQGTASENQTVLPPATRLVPQCSASWLTR